MPRRSLRSVRSTLFDLCLIAVPLALFTAWSWKGHEELGLVFGCAVGYALMWRRRRPTMSFALVAVLAAGMLTVTFHDTTMREVGLWAGLWVAMYSVVRYAPSVLECGFAGLVTLLCTAIILVHDTSVRITHRPPTRHDLWGAIGSITPPVAAVWLIAIVVRFSVVRNHLARQRAVDAERERHQLDRIALAEERAQIARELHDIVAHSLSVMIVHASGAEYALDRDPERARAAIRTVTGVGRDALVEMKYLVQLLRGDAPAVDPAPVALDQVDAVVDRARGAGLAVDLVVDGEPPKVPGGVSLAVYRIVQEALTNTLKHAGPAPSAIVRVGYAPDAIEVDVTDTGTGSTRIGSGGHGLVGMRERVNLYGGAFDAGPYLGGGWRVRARIPLVGGT